MIAADAWNRLVTLVKRARPLRGVRCATSPRPDGVIVSGEARSGWRHPWFVSARHEFMEDGTGEWRAFIKPGFVNGRDAHISMPADWPEGKLPDDGATAERDVPLTDDPVPYLVLGGWRNPLMPDSVSASLSGQIIAAAAEGYPKFFEKLGVKPAAKGGDVTKPTALEGDFDETRTREIRAMDTRCHGQRADCRVHQARRHDISVPPRRQRHFHAPTH